MKRKAPYTVFFVILIIGLLLTILNIGNLSESSILNPEYVESAVDDMAYNYVISGSGWDHDTAKMYEEIYSDDAASGNVCLAGLCIVALSLIGLLVCFLVQTRIRTVEQSEQQIAILSQIASHDQSPLEARLMELADLKSKGLITNEEYESLRKKALEN